MLPYLRLQKSIQPTFLIKKRDERKIRDFSLKMIATVYITLNRIEEMWKIDVKESAIYSAFKCV